MFSQLERKSISEYSENRKSGELNVCEIFFLVFFLLCSIFCH